jgi:SAM-dependent methyltransferase
MEAFIDGYLGDYRDTPLSILDVGSQVVMDGHRTYRHLFGAAPWTFTGLDVEAGHNVDVAVSDPYDWQEVAADSVDVVVSGQALEHVPKFWLTAYEIGRVLKPGGITMLLAPSGGFEHRYPVDCWRFYADGMRAFADHVGFEVIECGTDWASRPWADSYLVMRKPLWSDEKRREFAQRRELQLASTRPAATPNEVTVCSAEPSVLRIDGSRTIIADRTVVVHDDVALAHMGEQPAVVPVAADVSWRDVARKVAGRRGRDVYRSLRRRARR